MGKFWAPLYPIQKYSYIKLEALIIQLLWALSGKVIRPGGHTLMNQKILYLIVFHLENIALQSQLPYNSLVGSPLPYEFNCPNVSIRIAFQGGDHQYSVGAFSIEKPRGRRSSECKENPILCGIIKGDLYRKCPLSRK
jgi:hypothetical protein